jgi:hypothetical protein
MRRLFDILPNPARIPRRMKIVADDIIDIARNISEICHD